MLRLCLALFLVATEVAAQGLAIDIPMEAFNNEQVFDNWRADFEPAWRARIVAARPGAITSFTITQTQPVTGGTFYYVSAIHAGGFNMGGQLDGGILAVPATMDPNKPLAVAIHGHEMPMAVYPTGMLAPGAWGRALFEAGYITWVPVSMQHAPFSHITYALGGIGNGKGDVYGYVPIWTAMVNDGIDALPSLGLNLQYNRIAALGLSGGAHVAFNLMAYREDVRVGVFAGAQQPLHYHRQYYSTMTHERCWNTPGLVSHTQVKALIAPRPIQFQLGELDGFYPDGVPPVNGARDVNDDEIVGPMLMLEKLWALKGGGDVEQFTHQGGHVMDATAALAFLAAHQGGESGD